VGVWQRLFGRAPRRPDGARAGRLRDGKKHGAWIEDDGVFLRECVYRDGVLDGPVREWRDGQLFARLDDNGEIVAVVLQLY
jgi:hypothetical protein